VCVCGCICLCLCLGFCLCLRVSHKQWCLDEFVCARWVCVCVCVYLSVSVSSFRSCIVQTKPMHDPCLCLCAQRPLVTATTLLYMGTACYGMQDPWIVICHLQKRPISFAKETRVCIYVLQPETWQCMHAKFRSHTIAEWRHHCDLLHREGLQRVNCTLSGC